MSLLIITLLPCLYCTPLPWNSKLASILAVKWVWPQRAWSDKVPPPSLWWLAPPLLVLEKSGNFAFQFLWQPCFFCSPQQRTAPVYSSSMSILPPRLLFLMEYQIMSFGIENWKIIFHVSMCGGFPVDKENLCMIVYVNNKHYCLFMLCNQFHISSMAFYFLVQQFETKDQSHANLLKRLT